MGLFSSRKDGGSARGQHGDASNSNSPDLGKSRMGEAVSISMESRKASILQLRLPLGDLTGEAVAIKSLNDEAEAELKRLRTAQEELKESARRMEPAEDSSAAEHAELALRHLLEALARAWAILLAAIADAARRCCLSVSGRPSSPVRGSLNPLSPNTPQRQTSPGKRQGTSRTRRAASPDRAMLMEGEADVKEAHLSRVLKRQQTKMSMAGAPTAAEEEEEQRMMRARVLEDKANKAWGRTQAALWMGAFRHSGDEASGSDREEKA